MSRSWSYYNPVEVQCSSDGFSVVASKVSEEPKLLLLTTAGFLRRGVATELITRIGIDRVLVCDEIVANPDLDLLDILHDRFRNQGISKIIALGGGSVVDAAKVLSVLLPLDISCPLDKILRSSQAQIWNKKVPVIAIPTTSGTGAEVTPFATVWDKREKKKYSITGTSVFPEVAILDPKLTIDLPKDQTLYTALDAISHALESLWNKNRTELSAAFAFQSLKLSSEALPKVLDDPGFLEARSDLQQASLLSGFAICSTRTAIAHSISYPLTSHYDVPHGLACSFTLPYILQKFIDKISKNQAEQLVLEAILKVLLSLDLETKILKFVSVDQIKDLQSEMITKGRADNFIFPLDDLNSLLPK